VTKVRIVKNVRLFEKGFLGIFLGAIPVIIGFLSTWWIMFAYVTTPVLVMLVIAGIGAGILVDIIWLKKWVANAFRMDLRIWMAIFIFYAICVFGFFMGVPVFNVFLAIPAGLFMGRKMANHPVSPEAEKQLVQKTNFFTTGVMAFICVSSAYLTLRDPTTAANLEGMLRLHFAVTQGMIIALIIVGGAALLVIHWWLGKKSYQIARRWN
jgi:hypothetical protein